MNHFLMFYAPFVVLFLSIAFVFFIAPKDEAVLKQIEEEE